MRIADEELVSWLGRLRRREVDAVEEFVRVHQSTVESCLRSEALSSNLDADAVTESTLSHVLTRVLLGQYELSEMGQVDRLIAERARTQVREASRLAFRSADSETDILRGPFPRRLADRLIESFNRVELRITALQPGDRALLYDRARGTDWAELAADRGAPPEVLRRTHARILNAILGAA